MAMIIAKVKTLPKSIVINLLIVLVPLLATSSLPYEGANGEFVRIDHAQIPDYFLDFRYLYAAPGDQLELNLVPNVEVRAVSSATIEFKTQNGQTINGTNPETIDLPHLVLYQNGELTEPAMRTLVIELSGVEIPFSGAIVNLELVTMHKDPDKLYPIAEPIVVMREARCIPGGGMNNEHNPLRFEYKFLDSIESISGSIPTPTDYYGYTINVTDYDYPESDTLYSSSKEVAFLLENQWKAVLPGFNQADGEGGPRELVVYYNDMYPLRRDKFNQNTWIPREQITKYVGDELVPAMVTAFEKQSAEWGFSWSKTWTSYRPAEGGDRLSVALTMGGVWYHGRSPTSAHSGISIRVDLMHYRDYDSLTEGIVSYFHHELFHNQQRNINLNLSGNGDINGEAGSWQFISEGTAELAASIGGSEWEFSPMADNRNYFFIANTYLAGDKSHTNSLNNTSYSKLEPYLSTIYWRFLYEQCGGMQDGEERPEAGLRIIREILEILYNNPNSAIGSVTNGMKLMQIIIDTVFNVEQGSLCPFQTFQESQINFAEAIYLLQFEGGRCDEPGLPLGCGFYDPYKQYESPLVSEFNYGNPSEAYEGEINSSFGIDFVEVRLDGSESVRELQIDISGMQGGEAEFNVQVWKLIAHEVDGETQQNINIPASPENLMILKETNMSSLVISADELENYDRLGFVITRLDMDEIQDPVGGYTINLVPVGYR